jgi:hypothetical protein
MKAFKEIWKTDEEPDPALLTSMDTFICWRPWDSSHRPENARGKIESWRPNVERLHLDQNVKFKRGLKCVQGMIPLYPVTK